MTLEEFSEVIEYDGWIHVLTEFQPSQLEDIALAEAVIEAQVAFKSLAKLVPDHFDFEFEDDDELDFD